MSQAWEELEGVPNLMILEDDIIGGGFPEQSAWTQLKDLGIQTIIDARMPEEGVAQEQELVESLGMRYFNIPVGAEGILPSHIDSLRNILQDDANRPALIHCAIGGRVQYLWAAYQVALS